MTTWIVYEADGTENSQWDSEAAAMRFVSDKPGWCYGLEDLYEYADRIDTNPKPWEPGEF